MSGERIRTVTFEIDGDDAGATVILRTRGATLRAICSCSVGAAAAVADQVPSCAHVRAALATIPRLSAALDADRSPSAPPTAQTSSPPEDAAAARPDPLVADLKLLLEALLRAAAGELTTAVEQALRAVGDALAARPLPGVARVVDRISHSFGAPAKPAETALVITALAEVVAALDGARDVELRSEIMGVGEEVGKLDDLDLVEVARQRHRGVVSWETRLLVDVTSGTLYREEAVIGARTLSRGVCGRRVVARLALQTASREPPRIQLLQYELEPAAAAAQMQEAAASARKTLALPETLRSSPLINVACPLAAWLAPSRVKSDRHGIVLVDAAGARLSIDAGGDPGAFETMQRLLDGGAGVRALAGAFQLDVDGIRLQPWSVLIEGEGGLELVPLAV